MTREEIHTILNPMEAAVERMLLRDFEALKNIKDPSLYNTMEKRFIKNWFNNNKKEYLEWRKKNDK